jgi:ATP/ADP translocase
MVNICPKKEQDLDILYTKYWAAAISGLIGVCIIVHWMQIMMRHMFSTTSIQIQMAKYHKPLTRLSRGFIVWRQTFLPSRFLLAIAYIVINLVIMFTNLDWSAADIEQIYGMRCGW